MADTTGSPESLLDPINAIVLPIFAFLAILITILPGRDFYRVHNFPAFNIILVNNLLNIQYMVNAIIWRTEDFSKWFKGYGLCDFEVLLRTPLTVCLAFSLLRYIRHIANALTSKGAQEQFGETNAEKKRKWFIDILWCYTVPLFQTTLQHLVLNDRYSIIVTVGCLTNLDNSWLNIALVGVWFPILMISTLYYALMLAFRIFKHRRNIMGALRNSGSTLSDRQYMKLVILVFLLAFCYIPISCIFFKNSFPKGGITSYSWGRNHAPGWGDIYFDTLWHAGKLFQYIGWASIAWNILMFFFFGLNDAAIDTYRLLLVKLGMGKIWPSLRRPGQSHRRGTSTIHKIASWLLNKLDVIGWVLRKVENSTLLNALENTKFMQKVLECHKSRKGKPSVWKFWLWFNRNGSQNSQTTTTTTAQTMTTGDENERGLTTSGGIPLQDLSHKGSSSTLKGGPCSNPKCNGSCSSSSSSSQSRYGGKSPLSESSSMSALDDSDIITPAPSPFSQHAYTAEYPTRPPPAIFTAAAPHNPVGIFSPWRTNVNLPRNLFARQPQAPAPVRPHMANGIQRRPSVYRNPARENRTPDTEFQLVTQTITAPAHAHLVRRPTPFPVRSSSGLPNAAQSTRRPGAPWPVRSSSRSPIIAHTHAPQRSIELDVLPARVLADNVTVQFSDSSARDAEDNANEDVKVETNSQQGESDA